MIRGGYTSASEAEFSDEEFQVESGRVSTTVSMGKRKFTEKDANTLLKLENLELDSDDDEDVLVLDTEEDALLLDLNNETSEKKRAAGNNQPKTDSAKSVFGGGDGTGCHMKWLRTVGLSGNGTLKCTLSNSLDTLSDSGKSDRTESIMADTIRGLVNVYHKRRAELLTADGFVATPLHVIKKLAQQHGEVLHCDVVSFPDGHHRLELFSGNIRGIGEGVTKRIAAQMAAIDLLERAQLSRGAVKVPLVGFLPGFLTSNRVFSDLLTLCRNNSLPVPKISCKINLTDDDKLDLSVPPYRAQCWVGTDLVTFGESESEVFARREAAREMYNTISNSEYKDTPYAIGRSCRRAAELTASGYLPIMTDYKKKWLLKNRVTNRQLDIPEEEFGLEDPSVIKELEKDLSLGDGLDDLGYKSIKSIKKTIRITFNNKKLKADEEVSRAETVSAASTASRCVSVANTDNDPDSWY